MTKFTYNFVWVLFLLTGVLGIVYFTKMHNNQEPFYDNISLHKNLMNQNEKKIAESRDLNSDLIIENSESANNLVNNNQVVTASPLDVNNTQNNEAPNNSQVKTLEISETDRALLLDKLKALINDAIVMKKTSKGTRVGTIEKFMYSYYSEEKNTVIKNMYTENLMILVKKFQEENNLSKQDGLANPETYEAILKVLTQ